MTPLDLMIEGAHEIFAAGEPTTLGVKDGRVAFLGEKAQLGAEGYSVGPHTEIIDAQGGLVTPGLIDCHTHLVFGGDRAHEYGLRAAGADYLEIAAAGGGIASTMAATRAASEQTLYELAVPRLERLIASGVTTVEIKSGYGLDLPSELKLLRVAHRLGQRDDVDVVATFLGAHTIPPDRRDQRDAHVDEIVDRWIPAVDEQGIAQFCDVFVEKGAFTVAEGERILNAGRAHGLAPKLHVDQLSAGGGAELAARVGATSADHLEHISAAGIAALAEAGTTAVLLPGATVFLGESVFPPARKLIDAGVRVALSTDSNPGTSMTQNLTLMSTLGMSLLGMTARETMDALTVNAAHALNLSDSAGVLAVGRQADIAIFSVPTHAHLPYEMGAQLTQTVIKKGRVVYCPASRSTRS